MGKIKPAGEQYRREYDKQPHGKGLRSVPPNAEVPANNQTTIAMIEEMLFWEQVDLADPEAVQNRILEYFQLCREYNSKVLISGFCYSLGCTREELMRWSNGKRSRLSEVLSTESAQVVQKSLQFLEISWESAFANNGYKSPVTGIFLGKNNFGYADESVSIVRHEEAEASPDRAALAAKYMAALPEDDPVPAIMPAKDVVVEPAEEG